MSRQANPIQLSPEEEEILLQWTRAAKCEQRMLSRARIILAASQGDENKKIAADLKTTTTTVGKWRVRFQSERLKGLYDVQRSGKRAQYDKTTERRILQTLDQPVPKGYATWSGPLVAQALGDISVHQIWRVLRKYKISLARRHSWCISTDPEFAPKAAAIVGLYLNPPENAVVLSVDEKPAIQALERSQGWLRLPNGKAITGFNHEYKRHGTTTLFAALEVAKGLVKAGHYNRRRRREFLDFMNDLVASYEGQNLFVILDNLNTHKPKDDRWLRQHPNVTLFYTPTHASWLNQVEIWFGILWKKALRGASFTSPLQVRQRIDDFAEVYNETAAPFEWTKAEVFSSKPKNKYSDLCK
jgi:transposase